jgi:hypothetical protein
LQQVGQLPQQPSLQHPSPQHVGHDAQHLSAPQHFAEAAPVDGDVGAAPADDRNIKAVNRILDIELPFACGAREKRVRRARGKTGHS